MAGRDEPGALADGPAEGLGMPKENSESPGKCWEDRDTVVAVCGVTHSKPSLSCDLEIGWKLAETVGTEPDTVRGAVSGRGSAPLHPGCEPDRCASAPRVRRMSATSPFNHHTVADKQYRL